MLIASGVASPVTVTLPSWRPAYAAGHRWGLLAGRGWTV